MSLKSLIPNNDNLLSGRTSALNHDEHRGDTVVNDNEPPDEPQFATVGQEKPSRRRHAGGKPRVNFNLTEALRLRSLGYGYRKIARRMNNCGKDTVRRRLREYDREHPPVAEIGTSEPSMRGKSEQLEEQNGAKQRNFSHPVRAKAKSESETGGSEQPKPTPGRSPEGSSGEVGGGAAVSQRGVAEGDCTSPGHQPPDAQAQSRRQAAAGRPDGLAEPAPVPEPTSNYKELIAFQRWHGIPDFQPDTSRLWLVNGARNLEFCTHAEQLAVAVDSWHREYDKMPEFQNADRIWVILDPREDNRAFLLSIAADVWIRERVLVVRSSALDICRLRLMWDRDRNVRLTASREVLNYEDAEFAKAHNLIPISVPNAVRELDKLLEKPPEPEKPGPFGGSYGASYGPQQPQLQVEDCGDERCGFAF